jgi:hypothetical protein
MAKNTRTTTSKPSTAKPAQNTRTTKSGGRSGSAAVKEAKGDIATARGTSKSTTGGK